MFLKKHFLKEPKLFWKNHTNNCNVTFSLVKSGKVLADINYYSNFIEYYVINKYNSLKSGNRYQHLMTTRYNGYILWHKDKERIGKYV